MTRKRPYSPKREETRFRKALLVSFILHVVAVFLLGYYHAGTSVKRKFYAPIHMVELHQERPGPVAAKPKSVPKPKAAPKPKPKPKPAPKPKVKPKPVSKPSPKVVKSKPKTPTIPKDPRKTPEPKRTEEDVMERIKKMRERLGEAQPEESDSQEERSGDAKSALERIREKYGDIADVGEGEPEETPEVATRSDEPLQRLGEGSTFGGPGGKNIMQQMRATAYFNRVWAHVLNNWNIPPSLDPEGLTTIISVIVDREGEIRKSWIEESSGSEIFDQSAMKALIRATPLPSIPSDIPDDVIELGFRFSRKR